MPPFFQPSVPSLPPGIHLSDKTAIVTGSTAGNGLEICRQLLSYDLSNLVMTIRNISKGEVIREALLSGPAIHSTN